MDIALCGYSDNIDYLIIWGEPDKTMSDAVQKCYSLIASNRRLKKFKPKEIKFSTDSTEKYDAKK